MEELSLSVEKREGLGKGAAGRLRREGIVPAVLYGAALKEAISLQMKDGELEQVLAYGERQEGAPQTHYFRGEEGTADYLTVGSAPSRIQSAAPRRFL